uniref:Uncharacterized protein n=1 Tax=Anguilla anguilla TaxID=7936 RepID=A0A0E9P7Z9_ANGAN
MASEKEPAAFSPGLLADSLSCWVGPHWLTG